MLLSIKDCSRSLHRFQKCQDLPTRGARAVEQFSINGSLFLAFANRDGDTKGKNVDSFTYKLNDSTGIFSLYQTMDTIGAQDIEYFTISDKHYFAVAYHAQGIQNSVIYQWNGRHRFDVLQNISTTWATSFNFFEICQELFLAVTHYTRDSDIYKWKDNQFEMFQKINTGQTGHASTVFKIKNETFIAFASHYNNYLDSGYAAHSTVLKWSGNSFVKLQSLQTYGALDVKSFNIIGDTFLAFANLYDGSNYNIDSFIYKWDGSKFVLFQSIPTHGASTWNPFVLCSQTFLGVANYKDKSVIYRYSGKQFTQYQEISTQGARGMASFGYKGHTYLAIANRNSDGKNNINSTLYKWI